ncbi:hypothetical protein B1B00_06280 [Bacillus sp. DSM 27956]|uniref:hypothetical protein n=1 Tax=Rossellomorea vietnamensis TaxID=218284 RepID=UPI0005593703|nr:hypothetical protein [Rossellomorea vietnamensis]MCC5800196.1 hypothetical protein [Rossellomorea vietnamensis]OXS62951.1 hypothetical protein B1B00_06280 [Bacillus sp. DSM 27956]
MTYLFIGLVSFSILLLVISFFQRDRYRDIEKDMEELSMNVLQEHYKLKKRISVLEEELMLDGDMNFHKSPINEIIKNQVISLYKQGVKVDQITKQSTLSKQEVLSIIQDS